MASTDAPEISNCEFTGNSAVIGGAMTSYESSPEVTGCTFTGNSAHLGGAIDNQWATKTNIEGCRTYRDGRARGGIGGAVYNRCGSTVTSARCSFTANEADKGGGMYNRGDFVLKLTECTFSENRALFGGGIFDHPSRTHEIARCLLLDNRAEHGADTFVPDADAPQ